jgi:tRNA threonylcarbamoyl adenosine modification protein YjeE
LVLDEDELRKWGRELGRSSSPPLVITLTGDLGTGKTTLAQAICAGYGVEEQVTSPTYSLVHRYSAPRSLVYHVDLYRLDDESQLTNIGWDDFIAEHGIIPVSVTKSTDQVRFITRVADAREAREAREEERSRRVAESRPGYDPKNTAALIAELEKEMKEAATALDFETAARLRDQLFEIKAKADGTRARSRGALAGIQVRR